MNAALKAVHSLLAASSTLTNRLSAYQGSPAIFTGDEVPLKAAPIWISISEVFDVPADAKNQDGRDLSMDVGIWGEPQGSVKGLNEVTEIARGLLHEATLSVEGYDAVIVRVVGITTLNDPDVWGRNIEVRTVIMETQ